MSEYGRRSGPTVVVHREQESGTRRAVPRSKPAARRGLKGERFNARIVLALVLITGTLSLFDLYLLLRGIS